MTSTVSYASAFVGNGRLDILVANQLGKALYSDLYASSVRPPNPARYNFLDDRSRTFHHNWDTSYSRRWTSQLTPGYRSTSTARTGHPSDDEIRLLASWAAAQHLADKADPAPASEGA